MEALHLAPRRPLAQRAQHILAEGHQFGAKNVGHSCGMEDHGSSFLDLFWILLAERLQLFRGSS